MEMKFEDLNLNKPLLNALNDLGFETPSTIQHKTFSPIMSGKDIVGIAQTGTGKTFAFLLPILRLWKFSKSPFPTIIIIVPTRELVAQIVEEIEKLASYMNLVAVGVYGGTNMRSQKNAIFHGCDVVVGTPGRLVDLIVDGVLKTKEVKKLIIDEVDEMLHLGFRTQLKNIIDLLPEKRQNLMFSATMIPEVEAVIDFFTSHYTKIEAAPSGAPLENIQQSAYPVPNFNSKANLLEHLLATDKSMEKVLVFVDTKKMADALYERLSPSFEEKIGVIHGSKSQNNRFASVENFQNGIYRILIATDIIARGLDVSLVSHVINFDLPDTSEKYIHRIGRTGRAEQEGIAIAFVSEKEISNKADIETLMNQAIPMIEVPEEVDITDALIDLEITPEFVPFENNKFKHHVPTGPAFHEKKEKNKKVNKKLRRSEKMKLKYKKPIKRGAKKKKKKKK